MKKITIIGSGEIGSALGSILGKSNQVESWDKRPAVSKEPPWALRD